MEQQPSQQQQQSTDRLRVLPPAPPFVTTLQAIPSTVTTPTLAPTIHVPFTASNSRSNSFSRRSSLVSDRGPAVGEAGNRAVMSGASNSHRNHSTVGGKRETDRDVDLANSSFVSAGGGVYALRHRNGSAPKKQGDHRENESDKDKEDDGVVRQRSAVVVVGEADARPPASPSAATETGLTSATSAVDRKPAMIGYFGYMFGCAAIGAFIGVILKDEKGFTTTQVGYLVSLSPIFQIVLLPVLSFAADKYNCAKQMLCAAAVGSTLSLFIFTASGARWLVVLAFVALLVCQTPMNPLLDKHTLLMFPAQGRTAAWGYVRSYGAYGWGAGNPVAGVVMQATGSWSVAAIQYAVGQVALLYCMFATKPYDRVDRAASSALQYKDVLRVLVQHRRLVLFLFAACMMGMGYSFINNFLFIFLRELGGSEFLMGLTVLITVSTEIPIFQRADKLNEWLTERQMMSLAMGIWTVRIIAYSFLHSPWLVLPIEPLHGVTFALSWLPGVKLVSEIYPAKLTSSATGLLFTFVNGFGAVIGNVAAGQLYDAFGARWMFRIAAVSMIVAFVFYQVLDRYLERAGHPLGASATGAEAPSGGGAATDVVVVVEGTEAEEDDAQHKHDDNEEEEEGLPGKHGKQSRATTQVQNTASSATTSSARHRDRGHHEAVRRHTTEEEEDELPL